MVNALKMRIHNPQLTSLLETNKPPGHNPVPDIIPEETTYKIRGFRYTC